MSQAASLPPLIEKEGRVLLALARDTVLARLDGLPEPEPGGLPARLWSPQGAFVSLHTGARLRGCIGVVEAVDPLWKAVRHCAQAAAFEDPRFPPLTREEIAGLDIEISALAPPRDVRLLSEVRLGRDGLMVSLGRRRGLLLPQVALEQGWDVERFARETCLKAGLPGDALRQGARLQAFEAQVFGERSPSGPRRGGGAGSS